jgi:hypothetical protein
MKKIYLYVALVCMIAFSCKKEDSTSGESGTTGMFSVKIATKSLDSTQSHYFAVFSLRKANSDTIIKDSLIRLTKGLGYYTSDSISLNPGMYDVIKLMIYNGFDDCLYGSITTSTAATKLLNMPFGFLVKSNYNTLITPTIISGTMAESFGYESFVYPFTNYFTFQVVAWDTWNPTNGIVYAAVNFSLSTSSYTYRKNIGNAITTIVVPNDTSKTFTFQFCGTLSSTNTITTANAHDTVSITYPKDSLLNHAQTPFVIFVRKKPS